MVSQKLKPSWYVKTDGNLDPYREKTIFKTSRGILSNKIFNDLVGKILQHVTYTCSFCQSKGKLIDVGKMFGLRDGFLKDKTDHCIEQKKILRDHTKIYVYILKLFG